MLEKHVLLLLIGEEDGRYYVLMKNFNTFMYDYITSWNKTFL